MGQTGQGQDNVSLGIGLTLLALLIFGIQDATAKVLVQTWSPFQIAMMRYWAFALFAVLIAARKMPLRQVFQSKMPRLQILRGALLTIDIWLFALAIRTVPLAELHSIILIYPLLVTLLAVPLLGESVGLWRLGAVVFGLSGALVILRPGGLPLTTDVLFAVGAACAFSAYIVLTRKVAQVDRTETSMVYVGVVGLILTSAVGVWFFEPMTPNGLMLLGVVMVTTVVGHFCMMAALGHAPASVLQPFNYFNLPWAITLSALVFGHLIDAISLIGAAMIAGSGLIVWARERRAKTLRHRAEIATPGK